MWTDKTFVEIGDAYEGITDVDLRSSNQEDLRWVRLKFCPCDPKAIPRVVKVNDHEVSYAMSMIIKDDIVKEDWKRTPPPEKLALPAQWFSSSIEKREVASSIGKLNSGFCRKKLSNFKNWMTSSNRVLMGGNGEDKYNVDGL